MSTRLPPLMFRVKIERHIAGRWLIPARKAKLPALSAEDACRRAVRWAHSDAGVPPWRPLLARSMRFTTAKRTDSAPEVAVPRLERPLDLERIAA